MTAAKRIAAAVAACALLVTGVALILVGLDRAQATTADAPSLAAGWDDTSTVTTDTASPVPATTPTANTDDSQRLIIASQGIEAPLVPNGISDHTLMLPSDPMKLTVFSGGADPCTGVEGTVLVSGHVVSHGVRGSLWSLTKTEPGDVAWITCPGGSSPTAWRAARAWQSEKGDLDQSVFDATGKRRLIVITCGGPAMSNGHYRDNVIVEFDPVS